MIIKEVTICREVTFQGVEGDYLICDIEWSKPTRRKIKEVVDGKIKTKTIIDHHVTQDAKLKMDITNPKLLEKAKTLNKKDKILIYFRCPITYRFEIETWEVIKVLDKIDLLEINNQNTLIPCDIERIAKILEDKREEEAMKKTKKKISSKDKKIAELEQEIAQLKLQVQVLQEQLKNS